MKNLTKILCALLIVLTISCAKDGAVGPTGPAGTNGTNGTAGTNGTDGNANVMYSDWHTIASSWRDSAVAGTNMKVNHETVSALTASVISSGAVLVYFQISTGQNFPLPFTNYASGGATWSYIPVTGKIFYTAFAFNNVTFNVATSIKYRYIIIPGNIHLRLAKPLNQMTYDEVCELFNIPK